VNKKSGDGPETRPMSEAFRELSSEGLRSSLTTVIAQNPSSTLARILADPAAMSKFGFIDNPVTNGHDVAVDWKKNVEKRGLKDVLFGKLPWKERKL